MFKNSYLFLLFIFTTVHLTSCATSETKKSTTTYSLSDIAKEVNNQVSNLINGSDEKNVATTSGEPETKKLLTKTTTPTSKNVNWGVLLHGSMKLNPNYNYDKYAESYMRIYRSKEWQQYRNDEFELMKQKNDTVRLMKLNKEKFDSSATYVFKTSFKFGKYNFDKKSFPLLNKADKDSSYSFSYNSFTGSFLTGNLPDDFKIYFTNPEIVGDLMMDENTAKQFLQSKKNNWGSINRTVYARYYFKIDDLKFNQHDFTASLEKVYLYADPDRTNLIHIYSTN